MHVCILYACIMFGPIHVCIVHARMYVYMYHVCTCLLSWHACLSICVMYARTYARTNQVCKYARMHACRMQHAWVYPSTRKPRSKSRVQSVEVIKRTGTHIRSVTPTGRVGNVLAGRDTIIHSHTTIDAPTHPTTHFTHKLTKSARCLDT